MGNIRSLTDEEAIKERYFENTEKCPVCGSLAIEGDIFEPDSNDTGRRNITCGDCESEWIDCYKLVDVIFIVKNSEKDHNVRT